MSFKNSTLLITTARHYYHWHLSHPPPPIPPLVIKEGAGSEARMPFTHFANVLPIYLLFGQKLKSMDRLSRRVVELGCGTGRLLYFLIQEFKLKSQIIGIDSSSAAIQYAKHYYSHPQLSFYHYQGKTTRLKPDSIDIILSSHVIEHIPTSQTQGYLTEINRLLKPKGKLLLGTPNRSLLQDLFISNPLDLPHLRFVLPHEHEFTATELKRAVKTAGLSQIKLQGIVNPSVKYIHRTLAYQLRPISLIHLLRSRLPLSWIDYLGRYQTESIMSQKNITYEQLATNFRLVTQLKSLTRADNFFLSAQKP